MTAGEPGIVTAEASAARPARALLNPHTRFDRVPPPPGDEVERFHGEMAGHAVTPLRPLRSVGEDLGLGSVLLKDESDRFGLPSFKVLGASWAIEQAVRGDDSIHTVIAASAGNHGRAVARCARQRGLACRIFLPSGSGPDRARLIEQAGAEVVAVAGGYSDAARAAERNAQEPGTTLVADVSMSPDAPTPGWVTDGYATLFRELRRQAPGPIGVVLVPMGVGSLAAAAVRWAVHEAPQARVVGVEPVTAACITESLRRGTPATVATPGTSLAGLNCPTPSAVAWPTIRDGLFATVTVDDPEVHDVMRALHALGLQVGDCGAAPVAALRALVRDPACRTLRDALGLHDVDHVVCLGTEGASDPAAYAEVVRSADSGAGGTP